MAKTGGVVTHNTFVKGIITEAGALTFPENASIDEANFLLNRDGSRQRRLGMNYEGSYSKVDTSLTATDYQEAGVSSFVWKNAGNDANTEIAVVQGGGSLWFFNALGASISAAPLHSGNALDLGVTGASPFQYANINGILVISTGEGLPLYLSYNSTTDVVSTTTITLEIRDLLGVDDSLSVDENPASLSTEHDYNLRNQGWSTTNISAYNSSKSEYPDNTQVWHVGKDSDDNFSASLLAKQDFGNTPAAKGHYIIDAFNRATSRSAESGLSITVDSEAGHISTVAAHAGRTFYGGIQSAATNTDSRSPSYNGYIFFSRTIENNSQLGACYQEADPTSEQVSDLIDTDGGFVTIPEASRIWKLISSKEHLVVMADNGIWQIFGGDRGFLATEYQVSKITSVGAVNAESIVDVEGQIFYWADGGIYTLAPDQVSGNFVAQNITETTIQTLYNDIAGVAKAHTKSNYDPASKKISWLYNDSEAYDGADYRYMYDTELVLDTVLTAFYKNTISELTTDSPMVSGYMPTPDFNLVDRVSSVLHDETQVQADTVDVTVADQIRGRGASTTKYLVTVPDTTYKYTFAAYNDRRFVDWYSEDAVGINFSSFIVTGHELFGDVMRWKQVPYIFFYFQRTEDGFSGSSDQFDATNPSSCYVQSRWEWSDGAGSGRWGTPFQAYRYTRNYIPDSVADTFDYGQSVIVTKNKLRGKGKALSLYIYSETGKDMHLLGWANSVTGGSAV